MRIKVLKFMANWIQAHIPNEEFSLAINLPIKVIRRREVVGPGIFCGSLGVFKDIRRRYDHPSGLRTQVDQIDSPRRASAQ